MKIDKYAAFNITKKEDAAKYFLDLVHSGNGYEAIDFYYNKVDEETRRYMQEDSSCAWEIENLSTIMEI